MAAMKNSVVDGINDLITGFQLAFKPGIRLYVLLPLLVNVLLFSAGTMWLAEYFGGWLDSYLGRLPEWLQFLRGLLWAVFVIAVMLFAYYAFTVIARLIAAPFNSLLAERVEQELRGYPLNFEESIISMVFRSVRREMVKLLYMLPRLAMVILISAILFFIPGLNALIPLLWFVFGAWILALEYLDYNVDNHGKPYRHSKKLAQSQRQRALGLGGCIALLTSFPLINLVIMPVAVCAGTAWWVASTPTLNNDKARLD